MSSPRLPRLWPYLVRYRLHFAAGAVLLALTNVCALSIPRQIGAAIQALRDSQELATPVDFPLIWAIATTIAMLALAAGITRVFSRVAIFNAARLIEYDVRNEVFEHLTRLDRATYQEQSTGDLVSRCINDVTQIRLLFGVGVLNIVNTAFAYTVVLTKMFGLSPTLAWLSLAPYPLILVAMRFWTKALYTTSRDAQAQLSVLSSKAQEALSGIAVVKSFAIEGRISGEFRSEADEYVKRNMAVAIARGGLMPFMRVAAGFGSLIVLWFGGRKVIGGGMQLGHFVEFSGYVVGLAWPTMALGWVLSVWNRGTAAFDRTVQILNLEPAVRGGDTELSTTGVAPRIRFEGVSLAYEDGTAALHDVHLEIEPGSSVALVGPTGSGKTTLVHLIARLRDPSTGVITFDGTPLPELSLPSLRGRVGYVPQDGFLFSKSLRDNVLLGVGPDGDLEGALRMAALDADLGALADGLETTVGERGVTLSGGQRQRATLARAIVTDPQILVLDDALSAVDTQTERRILEGLREVKQGRTTVLVTHRYNALDLVDQVLVLDQGRIVERGSHRELIERGGRYAELVEEQRLQEEAASFATRGDGGE